MNSSKIIVEMVNNAAKADKVNYPDAPIVNEQIGPYTDQFDQKNEENDTRRGNGERHSPLPHEIPISQIREVTLRAMSAPPPPKRKLFLDERDIMEKIKKASKTGKNHINIKSKYVEYETLKMFEEMGYKCVKKRPKSWLGKKLKKILPDRLEIKWSFS